MQLLGAGRCELLFDAKAAPLRHSMRGPATNEPHATAALIYGVLGGEYTEWRAIAYAASFGYSRTLS